MSHLQSPRIYSPRFLRIHFPANFQTRSSKNIVPSGSWTVSISPSSMDLSAFGLTYPNQERCLQYLAGLDLTVENQYLLAAAEAQGEPERIPYDALYMFLGVWTPHTNECHSTGEYSQPEKALPEFPVEIWNTIIDLATSVPGAYDVHDYSAIAAFTFDSRGIYFRSRFESALRYKLALSLVSRRLNAIAQASLFDHLRISSGAHASTIAQVLERRKDMGKRTRRIDLALEGDHDWTGEHTQAMISIFQSCPNLVCFSTAFCDPDPWVYSLSSLIESLAHHRNLKRIEVKEGRAVMLCIEAFLQDLEVLWVLPIGEVFPPNVKGHCALPQLRALVVSDSLGDWELDVPNLRAYISRTRSNPAAIPWWKEHQIEYLSGHEARVAISNLSAWSNLQTLSIKYIELATRRIDWPEGIQHPTLQCIVIEEVVSDFLQAASTEHLQKNLQHIISTNIFPHLQCVKIHLSFMKDRSVELESAIRLGWLRSCVQRGLRIEMLQGSMERSANEWNILSRDTLNDVLYPADLPTIEDITDIYETVIKALKYEQ